MPVRIALDPEQLKANPLRVGLSMDAEIDVSNKGGKMLADAPRANALSQTQVYSTLDHGADAEVDRIIAANLGRGAAVGMSTSSRRGAAPASTAAPASPAAPASGHSPTSHDAMASPAVLRGKPI